MLSQILNEFYKTGFQYLPVVEVKNEDKKLIGFLERNILNKWVADKDRLEKKLESIPKELIFYHVPNLDLFSYKISNKKISVFSTDGQIVDEWNEIDFMKAIVSLQEKELHNKTTENKIENNKNKDNIDDIDVIEKVSGTPVKDETFWLGKLLLQSFQWPLFAIDLQGNTLFFNKPFEEKVLIKSIFKNSLRNAENYFIEKVRELLAIAISQNTLKYKSNINGRIETKIETNLETNLDQNLQYYISILNLEENGKVLGYFFIFQNSSDPSFQEEVRKRISSGMKLENIIKEIEASIIYQTLLLNQKNISHTAKALKIKRSTLQHKIQRLEIEKLLGKIEINKVKRNRVSKVKINSKIINDKSKNKNKNNVSKTSIKKKVRTIKKVYTNKKAEAIIKNTVSKNNSVSKKNPSNKKDESVKKKRLIKKPAV